MKISISIVDDHPVVITGLIKMLADFPRFEILNHCSHAAALLECLKYRQPDILLLDLQLPDKPGDELTSTVARLYPSVSIIAFTNLDQSFHIKNLFASGASGYLLKSSGPDVLTAALEAVYNGEQFIDPEIKEQMVLDLIGTQGKKETIPPLTLREQEILKLIADELTSQEIADKLYLSHRTIESHRLNLLLKFGVKNTAGLVRKAIQLKLLG